GSRSFARIGVGPVPHEHLARSGTMGPREGDMTVSTHGRAHDLVLLGATGFTGALVAEHLAARMAATRPDGRWAIAGRNRAKLDRLQQALAAVGTEPAIEVVDVTDPVGLRGIAARTRVLASTVGPYAEHGEPVVAACVEAGTDYCDITGEPGFVADLLR